MRGHPQVRRAAQEPWKSVLSDFRTSTTKVGLQLQSTLRDSVDGLTSRLNTLEHAVDTKQPRDQIEALIAAARPAAQTLWEQLHSSDAVVAAWEDLCRSCLTEQPEWDSVSRTRDTFVHLASLSGHGSRTPGAVRPPMRAALRGRSRAPRAAP